MSIRTRDQLSSQELSPEPKHPKMADTENEPTVKMIYSLLQNVQYNTQSLIEDNKQVKSDVRELKESLSFQCKRVEELEKENKNLIKQAHEQKNETQTLKSEVTMLNRKIAELELQQDTLEQYNRKHNLVISGIPEHEGEDLEEAVKELGDLVNVSIDEEEIDIVHRIRSRISPRPVIVKFVQYSAKKNLYMARKKLRFVSQEKFEETNCLHGASKIYINENLTSHRGALFSEVRKRTRQNNWNSTYTIDGKIFVKKRAGGKVFKIETQSDLEFLYE